MPTSSAPLFVQHSAAIALQTTATHFGVRQSLSDFTESRAWGVTARPARCRTMSWLSHWGVISSNHLRPSNTAQASCVSGMLAISY